MDHRVLEVLLPPSPLKRSRYVLVKESANTGDVDRVCATEGISVLEP